MRRLINFTQHQPLLVVLALLVFIGSGIVAFRALPIEAFPDVTDTQVTVISLYPGRAPEEVEKQVTIPLEIALAGGRQFNFNFKTVGVGPHRPETR